MPNETKKPHLNQAALVRWNEVKEQLKPLVEEEKKLRAQIFGDAFPDPKEGTNKLDLARGYVLKATLPITRKVDEAAFAAIREQLLEHHIKADLLVKYKPELEMKQYRALTEEELQLVDQFLIIKEGSPQLEIVPPKEAK